MANMFERFTTPAKTEPTDSGAVSPNQYALGIDLGGTSVKTVAIRPSGNVLHQFIVNYDPAAALDWGGKIRAVLENVTDDQQAPPSWIGISAPGLVDKDGQSIAFMPGRFHGLEKLNWRDYLGVGFPVPVMNDAHAALLGEIWLGAGKGYANVILLTLGTGVGGAILCDGRLLRGHLGRAGHLGHLCLDPQGPKDIVGTPGSLEDAIGNFTLLARGRGKYPTTHALVKAHQEGDREASEIWLKSVKALACGIVSMINIVDPAAVIIGGGIAQCGDALFKPLQDVVDQYEWKPGGQSVKLIPALLGEYAGAIGAAYHALHVGGVKTDDGAWRVDYVPYVRRI